MEIFPVSIATGKAFCNRVVERKQLKESIKQGRHTVVMATRRYGKTSLINQVLLELGLPYAIMELTMAVSIEDMERIIIKYIGDLLDSILPKTTKAKQRILKLFKWLNPEIVLTVSGQKLTFHPERSKLTAVENISEMLKKLDDAAVLAKKRVVVVMDEFQQVSEIQNHPLEAAIRHAMQYSKLVSYVFSGSHRHMLQDMFNSKNRPFYNSCEIMKIERISREDYVYFIQHAAQEKWHKPLSDQVLEVIFNLSEFHPSFVNRICGHFWLLNEFPTVESIKKYWETFIDSRHAEFTEDILALSKNQRKVLRYLACHPTTSPSGQEVCRETGLPEASVRQSVRKLLLMDYVFKNREGVIGVLDPAFRDFIKSL
ncbi:MAG TPA: hypothetical protein VGV92_06660 [Gammaproteobacteria bacterium]|nr:hypothetical protein [Gammaproteobacteria bacterium]